jgi:hypothetical protein
MEEKLDSYRPEGGNQLQLSARVTVKDLVEPQSPTTPWKTAPFSARDERYFCIFGCNGDQIIRKELAKKPNWRELPAEKAFMGRCNFIWRPCNFSYKKYSKIDCLLYQG